MLRYEEHKCIFPTQAVALLKINRLTVSVGSSVSKPFDVNATRAAFSCDGVRVLPPGIGAVSASTSLGDGI